MEDTERLLVDKSKKGDLDAFEELISAYEKKAYNIAYRMMGNEEDAKDMAQEAFIKIYKSIQNFREESSFSTWLYRIVTNVCLDELRKRKNDRLVPLELNIETDKGSAIVELSAEKETPEDIYERVEKRQLIQNAISSLGDDYKTVIILRDIQGFGYEEIASMLNCSLGTIKSRINRARNQLKDKLRYQLELYEKKSV
ncbi:RNA polymerase sigma factor [Lutispora saccharofermentans]|mgnify:FL=1|uniref:Sigma-70 family RNA polymerase sigma factor n=1 Tax=Lutispora saccharofermentans TaxID=3024236 RepID=A0ABT1NDR9_9FIRM|nr:sigma-70 family RNA polymerase sigma factor [Lutispora saccharofermentans]MCQ1528501.1 sigma-70 family RNA polymerase sigma factor [Lutispora saccharofermentans]